MSKPDQTDVVADDKVVSLEYTLTVEGEILDSTDEDEPIQFLHGHGEIIPGLERALTGMELGESRSIEVTSEEAYGDVDKRQIIDVSRDEFPDDFPLRPNVELEVRDKEGNTRHAVIVEVKKKSVKLDFNHPLAGKDLNFEVKVVGLREASPEEIDHGHVHAEQD